jgi:hypothetical protein
MAQTLGQLILKIAGETQGAEKALNDLNKKVSGAFSGLQTIITAIAAGAMAKWIDTTIKLGMESERTAALLGSTMKTTLNATNEQIAAAQKWAESQEQVNKFDAELLIQQLNKAIVKYEDLGTAQLAVSAAQEVARLKGIDVAAAYELVQGASNGMARSLKQFGVEAKEGTTQAGYLQQILDKTAGSTAAYNKTTVGLTEGMKLSYEVMRETLGQALLPIVNTLMTRMQPIVERITNFIITHMPDIEKGVTSLTDWIGKMFDKLEDLDMDKVESTVKFLGGVLGIALVVKGVMGVATSITAVKTAMNVMTATTGFKWLAGAGLAGGALLGAGLAIAGAAVYDTINPSDTRQYIGGRYTPQNTVIKGEPDSMGMGALRDIERTLTAIEAVTTANEDLGVVLTEGAVIAGDSSKKAADAAEARAKREEDAAERAAKAWEDYHDRMNSVAKATQSIADKIFAMTNSADMVAVRTLSREVSTAFAQGVDAKTLEQYVRAALGQLLGGDRSASDMEKLSGYVNQTFPWLASGSMVGEGVSMPSQQVLAAAQNINMANAIRTGMDESRTGQAIAELRTIVANLGRDLPGNIALAFNDIVRR